MFFAIAGLALSALGTGLSVYSNLQASRASERAERLRNRQANLEATRQRRRAIRESVIAQAASESTATAQGAQFSSSAMAGQQQIASERGTNMQTLNQSSQITSGIFGANADVARARGLGALGQGANAFGGFLTDFEGSNVRRQLFG